MKKGRIGKVVKDTQIHIAKNLRWFVLTKIFFSLLLITIMGPFIIRVWVEKIQLEPEMESVISRTVGVENVTTGSPLSGEIGDSPILPVTIANKMVWRF